MGADIHLTFEVQDDDGSWRILFPPRPDDWWYERILQDHIDSGMLALFFTDNGRLDAKDNDHTKDVESLYERGEAYFKAMSPEEVLERYGTHPKMGWDWYAAMPNMSDGPFPRPILKERDYRFFAAVAGVRAYHSGYVVFAPRGEPDNLSRLGRHMMREFEEDGHSHSWLMVNEMFSDKFVSVMNAIDEADREDYRKNIKEIADHPDEKYPKKYIETLRGYLNAPGAMERRLIWLRANIPNPDRTRMLFYFDN